MSCGVNTIDQKALKTTSSLASLIVAPFMGYGPMAMVIHMQTHAADLHLGVYDMYVRI